MYDLTPYIKFGEENVVAVRVDHSEDADSMWYTGSGIVGSTKTIKLIQELFDVNGSKIGSSAANAKVGNKLTVSQNFKVSNPQATDLYELCDELGFMVIDEAFDEFTTKGEVAHIMVHK